MKRCWVVLAVAVAGLPVLVQAADQIKTKTATLGGRITEVTSLSVVIEKDGVPTKVGVNDIAYIIYDAEPSQLKGVRANIREGKYTEALSSLQKNAKLQPDQITSPEVLQDIAYYKALCIARMALEGEGTLSEAGSQMIAFLNANANSYHYLEACELVGDMLVRAGAFEKAAAYYEKLAVAPWPDYKMRAGIAAGRALLAQKKYPEALKAFQSALAVEGDVGDDNRALATLGKARCIIEAGQADEAIKLATDIIDKFDAGDSVVQAPAYNVLGTALRKSHRENEALLAFLHVDLLYGDVRDAHIEALTNLIDLWTAKRQQGRAEQARRALADLTGG